MNQRDFFVRGGVNGHNLFEEIVSLENLFFAWKEFRRGKRKKLDVQRFEFNLEDNLFQLHRDLQDKIYQPDHYQGFYICDPKRRHIHKASLRDRVLHQAVFRILYPIFDQSFIFDSFSSRVTKGTHAGVNRLGVFLSKASRNNRVKVYALKCDIRKFFDSIDQRILWKLIQRKIRDDDCLWLLEKIIKSFEKLPGRGLPLGNVTSQLFANVYLNELDQFIKQELNVKYYLRYCDDFIILDTQGNKFPEIIKNISDFLYESLKLEIHASKILICSYLQGVDYLGYIARPYHRILRVKTRKRMFKKIDNKNLASYFGLLRHCNSYKIKREILDIL